MNKKIVFKAPIEGFQYLQGDAFNYHTIDAGQTVVIPANTQYLLTTKMTIVGGLTIRGLLTVIDLDAMRYKVIKRVTSTSYQILIADEVVFYNTDTNAGAATLPVGIVGKTIKIVNSGTSGNDLTVDGSGSEKLLGVTSLFTLVDGEALKLTYDTTEGWY